MSHSQTNKASIGISTFFTEILGNPAGEREATRLCFPPPPRTWHSNLKAFHHCISSASDPLSLCPLPRLTCQICPSKVYLYSWVHLKYCFGQEVSDPPGESSFPSLCSYRQHFLLALTVTFNSLSHDSFALCTWRCPLLNVRNVFVIPALRIELGTRHAS